MQMSRVSKILLAMLALAALLLIGFRALGGSFGLSLLYVRYVMREESAPYRDIAWQQGPTSAAMPPRALNPDVPRHSNIVQPNIVLIVVDDLGYADLTAHGPGLADGQVPTPSIDSIAEGGVNFAVGYSANATCAPSRAAIMTGRYPTRSGYEYTPTAPRFMKIVTSASRGKTTEDRALYFADRERGQLPFEQMGLPTSEITLGQLLQGVGYHTVHIGKWHLGETPEFRASARGFHESLSLQYGASMYLPEDDPRVVNATTDLNPLDRFLWAAGAWGVRYNDGEVFQPDRYLTDYFTDQAIEVIDANRHRPFFLHLAYNAPHTPLQATREDYAALPFIEDHTLRVYAAMIRSLDRGIGRVLAALRERGLEDNTLVLFTSDNGAPHYISLGARNAPFRGWKATYFEGGIRVPLFMRWPAGLPQGKTVSGPAVHFDLFATAAAAAGAPLPKDRVIDGVDLLPFARGERSGTPHERIFWRTDRYLTLREGDWKLQSTQLPRTDRLHDLATDPLEQRNLAATQAERLRAMKATLARFDAEQAKPLWQSLGAMYVPIDRTLKEKPAPGEDYIYFSN